MSRGQEGNGSMEAGVENKGQMELARPKRGRKRGKAMRKRTWKKGLRGPTRKKKKEKKGKK